MESVEGRANRPYRNTNLYGFISGMVPAEA